ncbi:RNA polymerase sigma-70 factor [bacterium]|nr:RNA polymerase sigma-70 factor [bacterium]
MKPYTRFSDRELVEAIRASDSEAFHVFYLRYYEPIYRFLWYRTHSTETAGDFTQEVFMRIWEKRETLDPQKSIRAYLYRIAYHLVIDYLKKRSSHETFIQKNTHQRNISFEAFSDLQMDVYRVIDQFSEPVKTVFCMSRFEGFKYSEIAEICGVSVKTVEFRISKALELMRKKLSHG